MIDKLRFLLPIFASVLVAFGFLFYVGMRAAAGDTLSGSRRSIIRLVTDALNGLADAYGPQPVGGAIMGLAVTGGVLVMAWVWRRT